MDSRLRMAARPKKHHDGRAEGARAHNELVTAWGGIEQAVGEIAHVGAQAKLEI